MPGCFEHDVHQINDLLLLRWIFLFTLSTGAMILRPDYGKLDTLASIFPSKSFIALTATASVAYQNAENFAMQNPLRILENPNRSNIFYEIKQRPVAVKENNEDQFEKLINTLGSELKELKNKFPLTILYTSLHLCGFWLQFT